MSDAGMLNIINSIPAQAKSVPNAVAARSREKYADPALPLLPASKRGGFFRSILIICMSILSVVFVRFFFVTKNPEV